MKKTLLSLLAAAYATVALLPSGAFADTISSEARPAAKPRSVILSAYFEDGIVTKAPAKKKAVVKTAKKPVVKKAVAKKPTTKKAVVKKAPVKKAVAKVPAKKPAAKTPAKK